MGSCNSKGKKKGSYMKAGGKVCPKCGSAGKCSCGGKTKMASGGKVRGAGCATRGTGHSGKMG